MSIEISGDKLILPAGTAGNSGVFYGKAKSETWTIVPYVGTGAAGNFVETLDVNGVARKPRRVIIKRIDDTEYWLVYDSERGNNFPLFLDENLEEGSSATTRVFIENTGFETETYSGTNAENGQYIALVEFDTNAQPTPDDSYFDLPTDDSNLNIDNGNFTYTNGVDSNGYLRSSEQVTQNIDFAGVSDGLKWVGKKLDGSGYIFEDTKPSVGLYEKQFADDNRLVFDVESGKHFTTVGGELVVNGTFNVDTSGWTAGNGATLSNSNGQLLITKNGTDYPQAKQTFTLEIGEEYKFKISSSTESVRYWTWWSNSISNVLHSSYGDYEVPFIAESTSLELTIELSGDGDDKSFDNISIYKLEPTLDQELATPVSFLPNPVMVASETPMDIREDSGSIATNVMGSLEVQGKVAMESPIYGDKPIYTGYAGGTDIKTAGVIFDWTTEIDTHNAYSNGLWTCPKDGWYRFNPRVWNIHDNDTNTAVYSQMYINGVTEARFYSSGTNYQRYISIEPTILKELKVGDTMYIESVTASSVHFIYFTSGKWYTNIVIEYIGETK